MTKVGIAIASLRNRLLRTLLTVLSISVAIARALVTDPTILLADEPTGDLDKKSEEEVLVLLKRLNTEFKKSIVMVTHDPKAAACAARTVMLEKGALVSKA